MKHERVFIVVSVDERLPVILKSVIAITNYKRIVTTCIQSDKTWDSYSLRHEDEYIAHFLEERKGVIVFTQQEFAKILRLVDNLGLGKATEKLNKEGIEL